MAFNLSTFETSCNMIATGGFKNDYSAKPTGIWVKFIFSYWSSLNQIIDTLHIVPSIHAIYRFSIGFASGFSGGIYHQLIRQLAKNSCALLEVCLGSFIKRYLDEYVDWINDTRNLSRMQIYNSAPVIPSNMCTCVAPSWLITAHIWTLQGCLGRGLYLGLRPFFLQLKR